MFFLSRHPNSFHEEIDNNDIVKFKYAIHWQSVIFNKSILDKLPNIIPNNIHNDSFISLYIKRGNIKSYGLRYSLFYQNINTFIRYYEYGFLHNIRASFKYGDPINILYYIINLIILNYYINYNINIINYIHIVHTIFINILLFSIYIYIHLIILFPINLISV
jgi:hypothetical protein